MEKKEISVIDIEINTAYMLSQACDLILRDAERRLAAKKTPLRQDVKMRFNRWTEAVKRACILNEDLCEDIYRHTAGRGYKDVQIWQEQENEMARFALMFADRSRYVDSINAIFKAIRSQQGEDVITEDVLKHFYLKKI